MAVLLVPGLLCSPRLYAPQLPALWRRGPVVVANTLRGESIAAIAESILADAPPRFALAGLSMGGYVVLELVRQAPERVERLALLSTSARPETPAATERRRPLVRLAESGRLDEVVEALFPLLVHESRHDDAELLDVVKAMAADVGAEAFVRQQHAIIGRPDARPLLPEIRCPTLVVHGDGDEVIPSDCGEEAAAAIPGARLVLLRGCGHLSTLEAPDELTRALLDWLDA